MLKKSILEKFRTLENIGINRSYSIWYDGLITLISSYNTLLKLRSRVYRIEFHRSVSQ